MNNPKNVLGEDLQPCCMDPLTGFYRDGYCKVGGGDMGVHAICIKATEEFLAYSASVGNDLSTPHPAYEFPGVKPGDSWCLCAPRWQEALEAGMAPPVYLASTNIAALEFTNLSDLKAHAVDKEVLD